MKKLFLALAAVAVIAFVGCSKDGDGDDLAGTTWSYTERGQYETFISTISFTKGGKVTVSEQVLSSEYGNEYYTETGTYSYNPPTVTFTTSYEGHPFSYIGTISGNSMNVICDGEYYGTYMKQ